MSKRGLYWVVMSALIILAGGVFLLIEQEPLLNAPAKLRLGAADSVSSALILIAGAQGFFAQEGLAVSIQNFDTGRDALLAMLDGKVDVATASTTSIMLKSFQRSDFIVFATIFYSDDNIKVITRTDAGIHSAQDLIGKRIGTTKGTSAEFFLDTFLTLNQVPDAAVDKVYLAPNALPSALALGEVDAIVSWEPYAHRTLDALADIGLHLPADGVYRETFNLAALQTFAHAQPQSLEKLLRALNRAADFVLQQKTAAQDVVALRLGLSTESIRLLWEDSVFALSLDNDLLATLENEAQWALDEDLVSAHKMPNYLDFLYSDALHRAVPQAPSLHR